MTTSMLDLRASATYVSGPRFYDLEPGTPVLLVLNHSDKTLSIKLGSQEWDRISTAKVTDEFVSYESKFSKGSAIAGGLLAGPTAGILSGMVFKTYVPTYMLTMPVETEYGTQWLVFALDPKKESSSFVTNMRLKKVTLQIRDAPETLEEPPEWFTYLIWTAGIIILIAFLASLG